jgi:threonine/homoserine/homoserine lactone efflux protein
MHPLLQGILFGFTISVLPGAPLFTLLQTSIHRGFKSGVALAAGIFASDAVVVYLAFLGALQFINQKNNYIIAGVIGGAILIGFGIYTFYHKVHIDENNMPVEVRVAGPLTYILKGFFLNIMNPFVWILWISAMVGVSSGFGDNKDGMALFFIGTLATIFSSDMLKVFIADRIKQKLKASLIVWINHLVGLLLVILGIFLTISVFFRF